MKPPEQKVVLDWAQKVFGEIALRRDERSARFIEEALELVQSFQLPKSLVLKIVERVYGRPQGNSYREMGQTMLVLQALAEAADIDLAPCVAEEWQRLQAKTLESLRASHDAKVQLGIANERTNTKPEAPTGKVINTDGVHAAQRKGNP